MKRIGTRVLMLAVIGVIAWSYALSPTTRRSGEVPERVRGSWRLAETVTAPEAEVRAFRLEADRVVLLDQAGRRELRALPVREVTTRSGRERIWGARGPKLYFGPRVELIRVYYGQPHPSHVAEQRLDIDLVRRDRIRVQQQYQSGRAADWWPDDASEYVRVAAAPD